MAETALALYAVYGGVAFAGRLLLHRRRTGRWGIGGPSGRPGSLEWLAGVGFTASIVSGVSAAGLAAAEVLEPIPALDTDLAHTAGLALFGAGFVATVVSQATMGASWRLGVDERDRTELVTSGPFAVVRNPIYASMIPAIGGLALLAPSVLALAGWLLLVAALQAQTRLVEEPYLRRVHGDRYRRYAERVGRFLPGVGRLRE